MVSQNDYMGDGSKELPKSFVNGTLTVFRHFGLAGDEMNPTGLKPMGHSRYSPESEHYPYENEFVAGCQNSSKKDGHKVPDHKCHCGFYASYDPMTDFYSTNTGYRVFAACEVSGRVIMGTKGVRGEKMKLKGMWIQPKVRQVHLDHMKDLRKAHLTAPWFEHAWILYDAVTSSMRMRAAKLGTRMKVTCDAIDAKYVDLAAEAAFQDYDTALEKAGEMPVLLPNDEHLKNYGVPIFETREDLLEAFPPDDVSSLIHIE